jgi:hypothetical protein
MFTTQIFISISTKTVTSKNPQDLIKSWGNIIHLLSGSLFRFRFILSFLFFLCLCILLLSFLAEVSR